MKIQYELLTDKFDDKDTTASTVGLIRSMAEGAGAHHVSALKFGLREGFSLARPKTPEASKPTPSGTQPIQAGKKQGRRVFS